MEHNNLIGIAIRYGVYSAMLFAWLLLLPVIARLGGAEAFYEGHFVEWFQWAVITLAAGLFVVGAWRWPRWRQLLGVLAVLAAVASVREQDDLLDHYVSWLWGWKGPVIAVGVVGFAIALRDLPRLGSQVEPFARTPAFVMLWAGTLTVIGAAQLIGHGELLRIVMGDGYDPDVKRVVEEAFESFEYLIVLGGAVETLVVLPGQRPSPIDRPKSANRFFRWLWRSDQ